MALPLQEGELLPQTATQLDDNRVQVLVLHVLVLSERPVRQLLALAQGIAVPVFH